MTDLLANVTATILVVIPFILIGFMILLPAIFLILLIILLIKIIRRV